MPYGRRENTFSSSGEVWSQKHLKVCKLSKVIFLEVVSEGKKQNTTTITNKPVLSCNHALPTNILKLVPPFNILDLLLNVGAYLVIDLNHHSTMNWR